MKRIEAVLLGIVMALGACGDDKKSTDCDTSLATIKLGAVLPITGNVQVGELWQNAARMALDDVNVAGGVNGHCVEMLVHDSQSSDTVSREQAQALLEAAQDLGADKVSVPLYCVSHQPCPAKAAVLPHR